VKRGCFRITFVVAGTGPFPLKMLQWDECFPHGTGDGKLLVVDQERRIRMCHTGPRASWHPNYQAWDYLNWPVDDKSIEVKEVTR
jgi:hypothetical protein